MISLANGLRNMDGYDDNLAKDGEPPQMGKKYYQIPFEVKLTIAQNLQEIDRIISVYEKERQNAIMEITNGQSASIDGKKDPVALDRFNVKHKALLDYEHDLDLVLIDPNDLKDATDILPSTLSQIIPIIAKKSGAAKRGK